MTGAFHAGNGWQWGLLGLLLTVMDWIIPSFPTFSTSKSMVEHVVTLATNQTGMS